MLNFEGISAKISWVDDQINSLKTDMDEFCKDIHKSIAHKVYPDDNIQEWIFHGDTPEAPIEWSIRIGEILYTLRSTLDHLVWQLVLANEQKPGHLNEFPIVQDDCDWQRNVKKLKGVAPKTKEMIKLLQPFTGGIGIPFNVSAFRTLQCLCNIDKHRHLNMVIFETIGIEQLDIPHNRPSNSPPLEGSGLLGKIEKDKVLLSLNTAKENFKPSFQINVRFKNAQDSEVPVGTVPAILDKCFVAVSKTVKAEWGR